MKRLFIIALAVIFATPLVAGEKKINSKINHVTVFQNGAQVFRKANTTIPSGRTQLVFSELAMRLDPSSIQVSGKGNFTVLSVHHRLNYLEQIQHKKKVKMLMDSVELINSKIAYERKMLQVYNEEAAMINANRSIGGSQNGVNIDELKAAAEFFRTRLKDIYTKTLKINTDITKYQEIMNRLNQQINVERGQQQKALSEIVVEVDAKEGGKGSVEINYLVYDARWTPIYDLRAKDVNNPVELHYRAQVYQNTGVDWKNVKLTISTGNPRQNGSIPSLYTWYLQYYNVYNNQKLVYKQTESRNVGYDTEMAESDGAYAPASINAKAGLANNSANYTTVQVGQTNTQFKISLPYTIRSGNSTVNVKIQKNKLDAKYRYYCVPKLDPDAFLEARVTGWEELNLMPGNMNVFFDGSFIGTSYMDPNNLSDTLNISLGRDQSIVVKRKKLADKSSKSITGKIKKEKTTYEISIRNTKSKDIELMIQDHIPLSRTEEIEVILDNDGGAKYNSTNGFLTWEEKIGPKKTVTYKYTYTVKYPKKYRIVNQ